MEEEAETEAETTRTPARTRRSYSVTDSISSVPSARRISADFWGVELEEDMLVYVGECLSGAELVGRAVLG